ncbi:hypothetical protein NC653_031250 [Populus alba x Populus x berolinensis]|uniref:DUF7804 domain-containing protein n=1 Tax=Populus alba x Populus x berolinensis TaxID=444605 RepID=A0AAD6Q155_9ROSI|nr:hypothetical protein NC653_031250 [Populus alba x Populus x berolinensis]
MKSSTTPGIFKTADSPDGSNESAVLLYEKVDQWMRDSVVEIVKNLREAPLSVHIYTAESNETRRLEAEKAVEEEEEERPNLMGKWEKRDPNA